MGGFGNLAVKGFGRLIGTVVGDEAGGLFGGTLGNMPRSLGAAATPQAVQTGGQTFTSKAAEALNDFFGGNLSRREWGRALEKMKNELDLPNNFHGKIMNNGDYRDNIGNIGDYTN